MATENNPSILYSQRQRELLQAFRDVTSTERSEVECVQMLERHWWNLDAAVDAALTGNWLVTDRQVDRNHLSDSGLRHRTGNARSPARSDGSRVQEAVATSPPSSSRNRRDEGFLISSIFRKLLYPIRLILGGGGQENATDAAVAFASCMQLNYGPKTPNFILKSYREAVSTASRESRFLLVYIHSELHQDTASFCSETLCTDTFVDFVSDNILIWGGQVTSSDAYAVAETLGCVTHPFCALLTCLPNGVNVVEKIQGPLGVQQMIGCLTRAMESHQSNLDQLRSQQLQREEAAILREEQDREYEEALEADRIREAKLRNQREQEDRVREEKERQQQLEAARKVQEERDAEKRVQKQREILAQAEAPKRGTPGSTVLRFHLHDGSKMERCFNELDTLGLVRAFVDVQLWDKGIKIRMYELATNFPRRLWGPNDTSGTLKAEGLCPQAAIYVQSLENLEAAS